jgi:hypothetical protein
LHACMRENPRGMLPAEDRHRQRLFRVNFMVKIGKESLKNSSNLSGFRTSSYVAPSVKKGRRAMFASCSPCQLNTTPVYPRECGLLGRSMRSGNRLLRQLLMRQHGLIQLLMRQSLIKSQTAEPGPFRNLEFKAPTKYMLALLSRNRLLRSTCQGPLLNSIG